MYYFEKIIGKVLSFVKNVCIIMLAAMLLINTVHVVFRYLFRASLVWSEEISLLLLIWFAFLSIPNELYHGNHMAIELFYKKFPVKLKKTVNLIVYSIIEIFCLIMISQMFKTMAGLGGMTLPISGVPRIMLYAPAFLSALLICFCNIVLFIKALKKDYGLRGYN